MLNCAVWARKSAPSSGLIGFWYLSWATRSLRKASLPMASGAGGEAGFLQGGPQLGHRPVEKLAGGGLAGVEREMNGSPLDGDLDPDGAEFGRTQVESELVVTVAPVPQRLYDRDDLIGQREGFGPGGGR